MPPRKPRPTSQTRPVLQWVMAALGAGVTLAVIGVVTWEALQPSSPAELNARIASVATTAIGHVAVVEVVNTGDETASGVMVEGVLGEETATATLDYVPGNGRATAWLRFDADPRSAAVTVKGWSEP